MSNDSDVYKEENVMLKEELDRILALLKSSQVEKNEIGVKYQLLSKRLEEILQLQVNELELDDNYHLELNRHKIEWKNELVDELSHYRTRLVECHEQQTRQAQVVRDLQEKVNDYQGKCFTLEKQLSERSSKFENSMAESKDEKDATPSFFVGNNYDNLNVQLVEERNRSKSLLEVNTILRDQLDAATSANQVLTSDIHKLTQEWQKTRQELDEKETQWRNEEQSFNDYFTKEHHQLLTLWHHIIQFRQDFSELRTSTERDLGSIRTHLRQTTHNATNACFTLYANAPLQVTDPVSWEMQRKTQENANLKLKFNVEKDEFLEKIRDLNLQNDRKKSMIEEKDKVINALNKTVETLEGNKSETVESPALKMKQELSYLVGVLQSIAKLVVDDSDLQIHTQQLRHILSFSSTESLPSNSNSALVLRTPDMYNLSSLGETTLTAVTASLSKKRIQLEELRTKLNSTQDQSKSLKKSLEECEEDKRNVQRQNSQLSSRFELVVQEIQNSMRDKDRIRSALDETGSERSLLEHTRQILNEQVEILNAENDKLYAKLREAQEKLEDVHSERDTLRFQEKNVVDELRRCNQKVAQLNEDAMKQSSEIRSLTNSVNRITFEKELLIREKTELEKKLEQFENLNRQLRSENRTYKDDNEMLNENLQITRNDNEFLNREKVENLSTLNFLKEEKTQLNREKADLERERQNLRIRISNMEQLEIEKTAKMNNLQETATLSESQRQKLNIENQKLLREKEELEVLLTMANHQKEKVTEELVSIKKSVSSLRESCQRLERDKEALALEKADLEVRYQSLESEFKECLGTINVLKEEKERLESALYANNQALVSLEGKIDELEHEIDTLKGKEESLIDQLSESRRQRETDLAVHNKTKELLGQKVTELQDEFKKSLKQEENRRRSEVEKMEKEKENLEIRFQSEHTDFQIIWEEKLEEMVKNHEKEIETIHQDANKSRQILEDRLTHVEMEKKQIESLSSKEYDAFEQKLSSLKKELNEKEEEFKRERNKTQEVIDREEFLQSEVRTQLDNVKMELQNTVSTYNKDIKEVRNQLIDLQSQRDSLSQTCSALKIQVGNLEETRDELKQLLSEAERQIQELMLQHDSVRNQSTLNEKWLQEEKTERENVSTECQELRMRIKDYEVNKIESNKVIDHLKQTVTIFQENNSTLALECSELKKTMRDVEQSRMELKRDLQMCQRQISAFKNDSIVRDDDLSNHKELHKQSEQRELELRKEAAAIKQKLLESEANGETFRRELTNLQRKIADLEHRMKMQQETHKAALEESFAAERHLEEQKNGLEKNVVGRNEQIHELTLRLRSAEGRIYATEKNYYKTESAKQDIESRYAALQNALRQTLGIGLESGRWLSSTPLPLYSRQSSPMRQTDGAHSDKSLSGSKGSSPKRGDSRSKSVSPARQLVVTGASWTLPAVSELDVDLVISALEDVIQKAHSSEREQEEWRRKYQTAQRVIEETKEEKETQQIRLQLLQKTLADVENEKQHLGLELSSTRANLLQQDDRIQLLEKERTNLRDKISTVETNLISAEKAKKHHLDKVTQLKSTVTSTDKERKDLEEARNRAENQTTTLELKIQMLEANIERCQLILSEKTAENQLLDEQLSESHKRVNSLEEKIHSSERNIDRLMLELRSSKENEQDLKEKLQHTHRFINESSNSSAGAQEQNRKLRQEYSRLEKDKDSLQLALQEQKSSSSNLKRECQFLNEKIVHLQKEFSTSESKSRELEERLKNNSKNVPKRDDSERELINEISGAREERKMLREEVEKLRQSLNASETIKIQVEKSRTKLERENFTLQKILEKSEKDKMRTEEFSSMSRYEKTNLGKSLKVLEQDNVDLQRKVQSLQAKLAELEQHHSQRLKELKNLQHQEVAMELERVRTAQMQAEQLLEAREKTNRHRILGLEQQISILKDQLAEEHRRWTRFHQRHLAADTEISNLRSILDQSLQTVSEDPNALEREARRLDTTIEGHIIRSPSITLTTPSKLSPSPVAGRLSTQNTRVLETDNHNSGTSNVRRRLDIAFSK